MRLKCRAYSFALFLGQGRYLGARSGRHSERNEMIRRDPSSTSGKSALWILMSQVDHAHLAGRLAEHWGGGSFAPLVPCEPLLWAIHHHDDGWQQWETAPGVDPSRGRPRSFTEMEISDSLSIWTGSIRIAAACGPLEAAVVAGHFCALARRANAWKNGDPQWAAVEQFLTRYERSISDWLAACQAGDPLGRTSEMARQALAQLQFFDALSLWFCCSEPDGVDRVQTPAGPELTLTPLAPGRIELTPWPFTVASLNVEIPARVVPAAPYETREDLAAAPSQPLQLRWHLQPDPGSR